MCLALWLGLRHQGVGCWGTLNVEPSSLFMFCCLDSRVFSPPELIGDAPDLQFVSANFTFTHVVHTNAKTGWSTMRSPSKTMCHSLYDCKKM